MQKTGLIATFTAVWLTTTSMLAPQVAHAQTKEALAKQHFGRGELHYQQGEFRKALAEYKKAQSYKRHPALIFNIAQCHRQLGEYKKALFFYKLFLSEMPNASNKTEVDGFIRAMEKKIRELEAAARNVGRLTVVTRPKGANVWVDTMTGAAAGVTPLVVKTKSGQHLVVIRMKGFRTVHKTVNVVAGGVGLVNVTLESLTKPRPVEPRPVTRPVVRPVTRPEPARKAVPAPVKPVKVRYVRTKPYYKRWWFWTGMTVSVLAGLGGAVMGVTALRMQDKWEKTYDEEYKRDGEKQRVGADIFIFSAVAIGLTTIIAAAVVGRGKKIEKSARTTFVPACGPGGCGVLVRGRW